MPIPRPGSMSKTGNLPKAGIKCSTCTFLASDGEIEHCMISPQNPVLIDQQFGECPEYLPRGKNPLLTVLQYQSLFLEDLEKRLSWGDRTHTKIEGKRND